MIREDGTLTGLTQTPGRGDGGALAGEFITRSPRESFELGRKIGEGLAGRSLFLLIGDLGAGKTIFVKGLAAGLGIDPANVTSPSFTLVNIHEGRMAFYHIDLYRLAPGQTRELGLEEIFEEPAVVAIEWADRMDWAPDHAVRVEFTYLSDSERRISIS